MGRPAVGADSPVGSSQPCPSWRNHLSCVMSWGCDDSGKEMKPQVPWVFPAVAAALVFQQSDVAAPPRGMPRHRCGSPELAQLPCTTFWGLLGMRLNTSCCPKCMGCLQQCHGACLGLGLWGACWGSVEAELWGGSCWAVLVQGTEERERRAGMWGAGGCFAQGVKLRLEEEKPAGRQEPKAGGGGRRVCGGRMDIPKNCMSRGRWLGRGGGWTGWRSCGCPCWLYWCQTPSPPGGAAGGEGAG